MASKDKVAIVSGAGWIADFAGQLVSGLLAKDHTPEEIHSLVTAKQRPAMEKIVDEVSMFLRALGNIFSLSINYDLPLAEAIAAGKYDGVSSDITEEHFPRTHTGTVELEAQLIHFNRPIESDDVLKELDKMGLRAGELSELLAFGAKYPEKQREFPVIALGSVWRFRRGGRYVPILWSVSDVRRLFLHWYVFRWYELCRFLAFRKEL